MKQRKRVKRRVLTILLSLVMVLGLMPGMSLTAYADSLHTITINEAQHGSVAASVNGSEATSAAQDATVTLTGNPDNGYRLKTISGTYQVVNPQETLSKGAATRTGDFFTLTSVFDDQEGWPLFWSRRITISSTYGGNINSVVLNITPQSDFAFNEMSVDHGSMTRDGNVITISGINSSSVVIQGPNEDNHGCRVTSAQITGTGTANKELTLSSAGDDNIKTFTMPSGNVTITAEFAHTHSFTYSASGASITATCGDGCDITEGLTLTISAPTGNLVYDGTTAYPATLSTGYNTTAFPDTYSISYTKDGSAYSGEPKDAGTYTASVTAGTGDAAKTASVSYTIAKAAATVTKAPTAKTLTYTGQAQELVTAGKADNGTMQYALGTETEATQPYTTSIPTATDAGTYYVWYKVVGDDSHTDSEPACVTVTIEERKQNNDEANDTQQNPDGTKTVTEENTDGKTILVTNYSKTDEQISQFVFEKAKGTTVDLTNVNSKDLKTVVVPESVKANGKTYKVTRIRKGFLKNCRQATKVDIGKNINTIDKNAFKYGKKVQKVVIRGKLKKVGKYAFKNTKKNVTIQVKTGAKNFEKNKTLLEKSGLPKNATVKRVKNKK